MSFFKLLRHSILVLFTIVLVISCKKELKGELLLVEANASKGFNFPYYLFLPEDLSGPQEKYLVVEPNNSGKVTDNFREQIEQAERNASRDFYLGNYASRKLNFPLLVPVFPRDKTTSQMYTHSLDRDVVLQQGNDLGRIDLQLLAMVKDAKQKLLQKGISVAPQFLMTGFSASGSFANRFSLIHPKAVKAVAAGGVNGILMLPFSEENGQKLTYPAGTYDFESLFGQKFDSAAFKSTPQFYFMGELDDNDALPYSDAYDETERNVIRKVLDEKMLPARWEKIKEFYAREKVNAKILTYDAMGHEHPKQVKEEIVAFFEKVLRE